MSFYQPSVINSSSSKKTNDQYEEQDFEFLAADSQSVSQLETTNLKTPIADPTNLGRSEIDETTGKRFKVSEEANEAIFNEQDPFLAVSEEANEAIINEQDPFLVVSEKVDEAIINEQDPFLVVCQQIGQLVGILIFNICYIQGVFPENCFKDELFLELKVKKLSPINAESCMLTDWMEKCLYDALQQRYLKTWVFGIIEESKGHTEVYTFSFEYLKHGVSMTIGLNGEEMTATFDATSRDITPDQMRRSAYKMVRALLQMMIHQDQMPGERTIMMKQMYFEDVTPGDYMPRLFRECSDIQTNWWIPLKMEAGNATDGHLVTFKVNYVLGSCEDEFMLLKEEIGYCSADTIDSSDGSEDQLAHVHGTTILAIEHHTGIFMACDGWSFKGETLHGVKAKKLSVLGRKRPHVVLANSCGSSVWFRAIIKQLKEKFEKGATYTVQDCAEFTLTALKNEDFLQHCYRADDLKDFKAKEEAKRTAIIFGSYEPKPNGEGNDACIKQASLIGIKHVRYVCDGSGAEYAVKVIKSKRFYNLSFEKAKRKIEKAMLEASEKDECSGGLIRIKHINSENHVTHVERKYIREIEEEKDARRKERKRKRCEL